MTYIPRGDRALLDLLARWTVAFRRALRGVGVGMGMGMGMLLLVVGGWVNGRGRPTAQLQEGSGERRTSASRAALAPEQFVEQLSIASCSCKHK